MGEWKTALSLRVRRRYVAHNVMEGVVLSDSKRRQRFFASQQQIQLIIAVAKEPYRTFYGLAAETGLRPGELCGLTVDDLDLERGYFNCSGVRGAGN
jgi:integrase